MSSPLSCTISLPHHFMHKWLQERGIEEQDCSQVDRARALLAATFVSEEAQPETFEVYEQGTPQRMSTDGCSPAPCYAECEADDAENAGVHSPSIVAARSAVLSEARAKRKQQAEPTLLTVVDAPDQVLAEEEADEASSMPATPVKHGVASSVLRAAKSAQPSPVRGSTKPPLSPGPPSGLVCANICESIHAACIALQAWPHPHEE